MLKSVLLTKPHKCVAHDMSDSGDMINKIDTESTKRSYKINRNGKNLSNDNKWKSSRLYSLENRRLL